MRTKQLSRNFWLAEFTRSQVAARAGIPVDVPLDGDVRRNLERLCIEVLQPLREELGPVFVTSGYRPPELNERVGGSPNSSHLFGLAADIVVTGRTPLAVSHWLAQSGLPFDQVIHEFDRWTHVSIARQGARPRGEVLTARLESGRVSYLMGVRERRGVAA